MISLTEGASTIKVGDRCPQVNTWLCSSQPRLSPTCTASYQLFPFISLSSAFLVLCLLILRRVWCTSSLVWPAVPTCRTKGHIWWRINPASGSKLLSLLSLLLFLTCRSALHFPFFDTNKPLKIITGHCRTAFIQSGTLTFTFIIISYHYSSVFITLC